MTYARNSGKQQAPPTALQAGLELQLQHLNGQQQPPQVQQQQFANSRKPIAVYRVDSNKQRRTLLDEWRQEPYPNDTESNALNKQVLSEMFCLGAIGLNTIEAMVDHRTNQDKLGNLEKQNTMLEHRIAELNYRANLTQLVQDAQLNGMNRLSDLVEISVERVDHIATHYPVLAVVSADLVARFHILGAGLEKLRTSFLAKRPDLEALASVTMQDVFISIDPESIPEKSVSLQVMAPNVLRVQFAARVRSGDTAVYEIASFDTWTDLISQPKLRAYDGPKFVLYNVSNDCAVVITEPVLSYVTGNCKKRQHYDPHLQKRKTIVDDDLQKVMRTQQHEAWPNIHIYC